MIGARFEFDSTARQEYWDHAARPLTSLVFVLPLLAAYEAGILCYGLDAMRNGAEVWLRHLLQGFGFGQYFLLPLLTCAVLLAWHHLTRQAWELKSSVLGGMLVESTVLALLLLIFARIQFAWFGIEAARTFVGSESWGSMLSYCGAGVYEELLFRAMLFPGMILLLQLLGVDRSNSVLAAICATSLAFAAAHYQFFSGSGEPLEWRTFLFRWVARAFFCVLYRFRGFGISVGTHTLYDIFVGV